MDIKVISADKKEMVIKNATVLNGVIVTGANGRYTPYFNRALLISTGKTDVARKAPAIMSAEKIAEKLGKIPFSDYNYNYSTFTANGYLWAQWTDHCGNVMRTKRIRKL